MSTILVPAVRFSTRAVMQSCIDAFGLEVAALHAGETDDVVVHAELRLGDGWLMCSAARPDGETHGIGGASLYFIVDAAEQVDQAHARAVAAGMTSAHEPSDEDYGGRGCSLHDTDGNVWSFGTYRPPGL